MAFIYETNDFASKEVFTTHYYKTSYEKLKKSLIEFAEKNDYKVYDWNDEYFEGCLIKNGITLNVVISMQSRIETALDFAIEANYLFFAKQKTIQVLNEIYDYLGQNHQLIGVGLHKQKNH